MRMRSRLVLLIVTFIFVWGCEDSSQTSSQPQVEPQVVRRKIAAEPSATVNTQQKPMAAGASSSAAKPPDKEIPLKTQLPSTDPATALLALKDTAEQYRYQGIVDPFLPLIKEEKNEPSKEVSNSDSQKKKRAPQTPLEKIDLTQLTLTAVFKGQNQSRGLVEESAGKGYIVTSGTYIGLDGGQITNVLEDRILITEISEDVMGKSVTIERELKLRQSSGE